jgi:hypothetical protein
MTPNEKDIIEALAALRLAVHDIHYAFGEALMHQRGREGESRTPDIGVSKMSAFKSGQV